MSRLDSASRSLPVNLCAVQPSLRASFSGIAHTQSALAVGVTALIIIGFTRVEVEVVRISNRMTTIIHSVIAAPLITCQEQIALHMKSKIPGLFAGARLPGSIGGEVKNSLQLSHIRQPPVRVPSQPQIAAVLHRPFPAHVLTVVFPRPHHATGRVYPKTTYLSFLLATLALRYRLSARDECRDREHKRYHLSPTSQNIRS